jgi:hypothetical protein
VEVKVPISRMEEIIRMVREVEKQVDTVIAIGVGARCDDEGHEQEVFSVLQRLGYEPERAKTNLGLGRITNSKAIEEHA